jgi:hypothetical protein
MIVSDNLKTLYYANPRTGSLTTAQGMLQGCRGHVVGTHHSMPKSGDCPGYHRWMVVRHPVARMWSWWWHCAVARKHCPGASFGRFLELVATWRKDGCPHEDVKTLFRTQSDTADRLNANSILLYENLPTAFEILPFDASPLVRYWKASRSHASPHTSPLRECITEAEWAAVYELEAADFERWGYTAEMYPGKTEGTT